MAAQPIFGSSTPSIAASPQNQNIAYYAALFDHKYPGKGAGAAYTAYAEANPSLTPYQAAQAFLLEIGTAGLAKAIADAAAATAQATGQAAVGGAIGAEKAAKTISSLNPLSGIASILSGLTSGNFWLRVGEVLAGLILLGIGVNALFHGKPMQIVTNAAGAVPKVVPV